MKVFIAYADDDVIGVYDSVEKCRLALENEGFIHYPHGHPDQERLALWGARWLKEIHAMGRTKWQRGYIGDHEVE